MSLKAFHVFFISVSVLLCLGFGWWCFSSDSARGREGYSAAGAVSFLLGLALVVYEVNFLKKFKDNP